MSARKLPSSLKLQGSRVAKSAELHVACPASRGHSQSIAEPGLPDAERRMRQPELSPPFAVLPFLARLHVCIHVFNGFGSCGLKQRALANASRPVEALNLVSRLANWALSGTCHVPGMSIDNSMRSVARSPRPQPTRWPRDARCCSSLPWRCPAASFHAFDVLAHLRDSASLGQLSIPAGMHLAVLGQRS